MFNFLKIETGNCAGLQSHIHDLSYSFFIRHAGHPKRPVFRPPLSYFPNTIKYIIVLGMRRGRVR
jgi:hypothetical protein